MKQGKAMNRSRLFQPNPHSCKVGIIDTTIKGKKSCSRDDKNVTTYCELVSALFLQITEQNDLQYRKPQKDLIIKESLYGYCQWHKDLFLHTSLSTTFFYSPFKLKLMPSVSNRSKAMNSIHKTHHASLTAYF